MVCDKFEAVKRLSTGASGSTEDDGWDIVVPPGLHSMMSDDDKTALEVENGSSHSIRLSTTTMKSLFDPLVDSIVLLAKQQLAGSNVAVNKVFLVGGFADSQYLVNRMRQALSTDAPTLDAVEVEREVVVPAHPYAAVLWGAVQYGCRPDLISARRSKMSYGISCSAPYQDGAPDKFWHEEEGQFYCNSVFKSFVERNQLIEVNEVVDHYFIPLYKLQDRATIDLWVTDAVNTRFVSDDDSNMRKLAEMEIQLPPCIDDLDSRIIRVSMMFGRVRVEATAVEESTGEACRTRFKFAANS
eukprot:gene30766-35805_t